MEIISSTKSFETQGLELLLMSFHQDCGSIKDEQEYIKSTVVRQMTAEQRQSIKTDLSEFLEKYSNEKSRQNAWFKMGGHYWPGSETLSCIIQELS